MKLSEQRIGEAWLVLTNIIWGFFPIMIILSYSSITPLFSAAYSVLIAAVFFAYTLTYKKLWPELLKKEAWFDIFMTTIIISVGFYVLTYIALLSTTAGNLSIIGLMEIFFSFVIFQMWYKEPQKHIHMLGAIIMAIGALIILFPGEFTLHKGDLLVLIAAFIAPFGNFFQKRARKKVNTHTILFLRSLIAGIILLVSAYIFETQPSISNIQTSSLFIILNGILLFGISKIGWVEAIHTLGVPKSISFISITPAITLIFAYFILGEIPTIWQILGFIPIAIGSLLIVKE